MEKVQQDFACGIVRVGNGWGVLFQERSEMQGGRAVGVEEESWVGGRRWKSGEVDGFLGPLRGVGG